MPTAARGPMLCPHGFLHHALAPISRLPAVSRGYCRREECARCCCALLSSRPGRRGVRLKGPRDCSLARSCWRVVLFRLYARRKWWLRGEGRGISWPNRRIHGVYIEPSFLEFGRESSCSRHFHKTRVSGSRIPYFAGADFELTTRTTFTKLHPFTALLQDITTSIPTSSVNTNMGKSKMDDAAAERIRRARGDKVCMAAPKPCPLSFYCWVDSTNHHDRTASANEQQTPHGGTSSLKAAVAAAVVAVGMAPRAVAAAAVASQAAAARRSSM